MPLSRRDSRALSGGGIVIVVLLAWLLWPDAEAPPPAPPQPVAPPPAPIVVVVPPPAAPAVDVSQLRLFGVMASGAVIGMADGSQRFVPVGREIVPGVSLLRVELHHAVLATAAGEVRLGFDGVAPALPTAATPAQAARSDETLRYRLGLAPRMVGGRVSGFTMRPGASLPALARAGIQPGDVILRVNGSELDEERREELAWTLANSGRVEFEIERGGRPLRLTLQSRPQ
jgi:general secretion pathway protein C